MCKSRGEAAPPRDDVGQDTWTGFLQAKAGERDVLTTPQMLAALDEVIREQNAECEKRANGVRSLRNSEDQQRKAAAVYHPHVVENFTCLEVLEGLLTVSRARWAALLNERIAKLSSLKPNLPLPRTPLTSLPTYRELYEVTVDGLNASETQHYIATSVLGSEVPSNGLEAFGIHSVFQSHVRALAPFCTILPGLPSLRQYFSALAPATTQPSCSASPMDSNVESYEEHLDTLLRSGGDAQAISKVLRGGVHPSVRRLYYARALQLPLVVTDGRPLFIEHGEFEVNHFPRQFLPAYLTFATKKSRERVKRRQMHSPMGNHSAVLLQPLMQQETETFVGNSEKYFVFTEEVAVLATTIMADIGVSDEKLKLALSQLGRPEDHMDAYRWSPASTDGSSQKKRSVVQQAFLPAGCSLLMAPLCNVTGDTVEQYELLSAMMSQVWKRLLGPTPELLQCCWLFERLTEEHALPAVANAIRVLQHPPLLLAMQWMTTGFAEVFSPTELLMFWDVLFSYHVEEMLHRSPLASFVRQSPGGSAASPSDPPLVPCALWLLPIMAAALFVFRAPMVERAETKEEFFQIFAVSHHLQPLPLLQYILFG